MRLFLALLLVPTISFAAVDSKAVDKSINDGVEYLYKQQAGDNWEKEGEFHHDQKTGQTALVVYALLASGQSAQDPRINKAVDYLKKTDADGAFALGFRCLVWLTLPKTPETKRMMQHDAKILQAAVINKGDSKGLYPATPGAAYGNSTAGQHAVLGMWAAGQSGIEVPRPYWTLVENAWTAHQDGSGGWAFTPKPSDKYPLTPECTAVGVATLLITGEYLHPDSEAATQTPAVTKGMKWLVDNFDKVPSEDRGKGEFPFSTLFAYERVAVASGLRKFGDKDWYDKGANWLLEKQKDDGSWPKEFGSTTSTALAVLFLSRGQSPLALSKLNYSTDGKAWNARPRDASNVSRYVGRQIEKEINWQAVSITEKPEEWHDAPILYLSGAGDIPLDEAGRDKLKQFILQGGVIVGNVENGNKTFADAFRKLGQTMFPAYEFRELPADHVIYTHEQFPRSKWKTPPSCLGLSNGVREFMLLLNGDPAKYWQSQNFAVHEAEFQLLSDIFLAWSDPMHLHKRGERYWMTADSSIKATKTIKLARIKYNGNWDPEPAGWQRLAAALRKDKKVDLQVSPVDIAGLHDFTTAHLTGTGSFKLDAVQRSQLASFINTGGTLVVDSAGGGDVFAEGVTNELNQLNLGKLETVDKADPLYAGMAHVEYRPIVRSVVKDLTDAPRVQVIKLNGRPAIFFSHEDLSAGLVGEAIDGVVGYQPATASEIMSRLLLTGK